MQIDKIREDIHPKLFEKLEPVIKKLRPAQSKAIEAGLLDGSNLLICTPTASGKTLIAELTMLNNIYKRTGKAIYIVPLKALATEKYRQFKERYQDIKVAISIGDVDSKETYLSSYDLIICTSEKLDSLIRHHSPWLKEVKTVIIDEIHLLNDPGRGPTLEILITMLRLMLKEIQLIGLSATIGNPDELAAWLDASLIIDTWRPVILKQGVMTNDNTLEFYD